MPASAVAAWGGHLGMLSFSLRRGSANAATDGTVIGPDAAAHSSIEYADVPVQQCPTDVWFET